MRLVLLLLFPPLLMAGLALLAIWLPLPPPFPEALGDTRVVLVALITAFGGAFYLVGVVFYVMLAYIRLGQATGAELLALGWRSNSSRLLGRRYLGEVGGCPAEVTTLAPLGLWAAQLDLYVECRPPLCMALGRRRPLLDLREGQALLVPLSDGTTLTAAAVDLGAARRLLDNPRFFRALERLMAGRGLRELYLQPGRAWVRMRYRGAPAGMVAPLLEAVEGLVESMG